MSLTVPQLIEQSHETALVSGLWKDGVEERSVYEIFNNFMSESLESWEEYRANRMSMWWSLNGEKVPACDVEFDGELYRHYNTKTPLKIEGAFVELADLAIRLADCFGAYDWIYFDDTEEIGVDINPEDYKEFPRLIASVNLAISNMVAWCVDCGELHWIDEADVTASWIILFCIEACKFHGEDLLELCKLKMAFNKTRGFRHGGKLA